MSLREKILTTDFEAWNDKPSPWTAGVLGGVGGLLGSTVAGELGSSNRHSYRSSRRSCCWYGGSCRVRGSRVSRL